MKEICGEMKPCESSDKFHVRCKVEKLFNDFQVLIKLFKEGVIYKMYLAKLIPQVVFAGPIYWIIERDIFDSWIRGETATFSCKISRQSFDVVTCENLLQAKIEGLFVANIMLILLFIIVNLSLLVTTMFRLWLETSYFPLNVFASFTSKSGSSRYSLLEFAFVMELLKQQHPICITVCFKRPKYFYPAKYFSRIL